MVEKRDYYEVLGVERDADRKTIKRAFLKLARKVHPDVSDDPAAEEQFKELNEAYSVLSDDVKRANYDRFGTAEGAGGSGYVDFSDIFGGMGVDDIFSSFFGGRSASSQRGRAARRQGRDMAISLEVTLEEVARGCKKTIAYDRLAPCDDCGGTGMAEGASEQECPRCHGTGFVTTVQRSVFGQVQSSSPCPECGGEGTVLDSPCEMCDGQGRTPNHERIDVRIPAGISSGGQLRVQGMGEAGMRGAPAGDLIVSVRVRDHERFQRSGDDLVCEIEVSMVQAALGCTVEVAGIMPDETIPFEIAAGTQHGELVIVEGLGMPRMSGGGRGRSAAQVRVLVPRELPDEARALLARYAALMGESVESDSISAAAQDAAAASEAELAEHDKPSKSVVDRIRDAIDDVLE
ncbi:heat shock protein DnaJ domain protein [Coriobacterium glomerans PW2]|uniref:Chaperone protein DnaJ n=1 Tax=Coriobacterium glomerans (strain ATCC 49209 / DSM 20642 / JCM 10262 / PW2) TaxID=700015 RepID=F2N7Q1_CORGP|nr:molecular chaperone DnaJ [Coriobacterium glomerans]AEB06943.1 heat shock protein DnaJ domain protein [Coriobacterium glomerans PW2]